MKKLILIIIVALCANIVNAQWQQVTMGGSYYVTCTASDSSYLYVGTGLDGVFLSKDCGNTWMQANNGLPIDTIFMNFVSITDLKTIGPNIIAVTSDGNIGSIFISYNNAYSWYEIHNGLPLNSYITSISTNDSVIFITTGNNDGTEPQNNAAYYSTNLGANWISLNTPTFCSPYIIGVKDSHIYVGVWGCGLYLSNNLGATWSNVNSNDPLSIVFKDSLIFIGTGNGIFLSSNFGGLWTSVNNGLTDLNIYVVDIINGTLFTIPLSGDIYYSTNNGNLWVPFNDGITNGYCLNIIACESNLFVGNSEGLWIRSFSDITTSPQINNSTSNFILYPNPSNGNFIFKSNDKIKSIEVTNMLEEIIYHTTSVNAQIVNEINLSGSPKGIYFVKVDNGEQVHIEKVVLN